MSKSKEGGKITLGMIKGKGINTSVPSISIRFNANAEEIEELYQSDEESADKFNNEKVKTIGISDPDTSPLRYLPRLGKRSTSIDASLISQDSSPPTDRWKFFSEIKGKITKGVEEIKHRNQETEQASKKTKSTKETKDKDNSSLSDSDEISESSISKTCGIVSTTEGVEMSSDDETPSIEDDKNLPKLKGPIRNGNKHHRYRVIRKKKPFREGKISIDKLADLYEITSGTKPNLSLDDSIASNDTVEVESGVEALEDVNPQQTSENAKPDVVSVNEEEMIADLVNRVVNIQVDEDNVIKVTSVSGEDVRNDELGEQMPRTYLAPEGFVDLRPTSPTSISFYEKVSSFRYIIVLIGIFLIHNYTSIPTYLTSFIFGILCTLLYNYFFGYVKAPVFHHAPFRVVIEKSVIEIPAVKEYRPLVKIEGWMNEFPEAYNPRSYHISRTQSVYIKLQGNLLRISHTKSKIPKRALWNEPEIKNVVFSHHRVYNLLGAKVTLAPVGLNKRRRWSKKYPICITFSSEVNPNENLDFDISVTKFKKDESEVNVKKSKETVPKKNPFETQIFSKLTEDEVYSMDEMSLDSTFFKGENEEDEDSIKEDDDELDDDSLCDWNTFLSQDSPSGMQIFLFSRTDREKEEWFRNFKNGCRKIFDGKENEEFGQFSNSEHAQAVLRYEQDYVKFMNQFQKLTKQIHIVRECGNGSSCLLWINAILSRMLFDFTHDDAVANLIQHRIQRKLSSIKLPQFVEQITVSELNLGNTPPLIQGVRDPKLDHKGLWVDVEMHYEGNISLTLQTKLNLMRLKNNASITSIAVSDESVSEKWQNSDVDDTAESSTDEYDYVPTPPGKSTDTNAKQNSSNSKKFIKIVDKIAESKFFQAATENRYIKRAMEGVSNTDLCLKVELRVLSGTLVLNIPPPPSDRMWVGFRPLPKLILSAHPTVGEKNITFFKHLSNWIEKKLTQEFQKVLVIPNMEDIVIPVMISKLPT